MAKADRVKEGEEQTSGVDHDNLEEMFAKAAENPANQELEKFVAPDGSQWRRKLSEHELLNWVAMQAAMNDGADVDAGMRMFAQAANADTLGDVLLGKADTTKGREILDVPVACLNIRFMLSDKEDGCPYYAIVEVRHGANNEKDTLSLGGWMVVGQLARYHYASVEFPPDSTYLTAADAPGAQPKESYPHYFKIKQKDTPAGHMNYLAPAV